MERLFVYGTLAPGKSNHHILKDIPGHWEPATLRGMLLNEGWGAEHGCPGIVLADAGDEVEGFVFASAQLSGHWPMLDEFEGAGYKRVSAIVNTENEQNIEAYVYALNRST